MGNDVSDVIGTAIGNAAREVIQNVPKKARKRSKGSLPGGKGVAAGAAGLGLAALAPLAVKGVGKLASGAVDKGAASLKDAGDKVGSKVQDKVKGEVLDAIPGGNLFSQSGESEDSGNGKSAGTKGVGKGRRMPIQQDIDIGVPVSTAYNQWTQFEEWPKFMHRVTSVSQEDDTHVKFKTKIWGKTKEFTAEIEEQRPDERIKWRVTEGVSHSGVVTFHELGPRLTRVELNLDIEPGSLIEKAARGMRHVKRAVRADMARFKAFILMQDEESGEWRGNVEDGDVKKKPSSSRSRSASSSRSSPRSSRSKSSGAKPAATRSSGSKASASKASASKASASKASASKSSGSGSSQTRARSSSRRTRGSANGGSGGSSRSGTRSGAKRQRTPSHS